MTKVPDELAVRNVALATALDGITDAMEAIRVAEERGAKLDGMRQELAHAYERVLAEHARLAEEDEQFRKDFLNA